MPKELVKTEEKNVGGRPTGVVTDQQRAFVEEYLRNGFIATRAAKVVGYYPDGVYRVLKHPEIRELINERLQEMVMTADEVLTRLSEQARGEYGQYIKANGDIDLEKLVADGKGHLIKSIKDTRYGKSITFVDSQEAIRLLSRYYNITGTDINVDARQINFNTIEVRLSEPEPSPMIIDGEIEK